MTKNTKSYKERVLEKGHLFQEINEYVRTANPSDELTEKIYAHMDQCEICSEHFEWQFYLAAAEEAECTALFRVPITQDEISNVISHFLGDRIAKISGPSYIFHKDKEPEAVLYHAVQTVRDNQIELIQHLDKTWEIRVVGKVIERVSRSIDGSKPEDVDVESVDDGWKLKLDLSRPVLLEWDDSGQPAKIEIGRVVSLPA